MRSMERESETNVNKNVGFVLARAPLEFVMTGWADVMSESHVGSVWELSQIAEKGPKASIDQLGGSAGVVK